MINAAEARTKVIDSLYKSNKEIIDYIESNIFKAIIASEVSCIIDFSQSHNNTIVTQFCQNWPRVSKYLEYHGYKIDIAENITISW